MPLLGSDRDDDPQKLPPKRHDSLGSGVKPWYVHMVIPIPRYGTYDTYIGISNVCTYVIICTHGTAQGNICCMTAVTVEHDR